MRSQSFLANPSFRAHLICVSTAFTAALLGMGAAAVFIPLFQRFDAGVTSPDEMLRLTGEILEVHARYWPVTFVSLLSTFCCSWFLYGRMRGPLFRFVVAFRAIAAGSLPESVVIRGTDYIQEECAELNTMIASLRDRAARLERVEEQAAAIAEWAEARGHADLISITNGLESECKALRAGGTRA